MAGSFTPEFMEELKYKCDIVDIISQYIPLTKKGGRHFGCCPFHNEKTPSFCVTQSAGFYHCFGCGVSGDVVKFIMDIESLPFYDAVKLLAEKAGMQLPEFKTDPNYGIKKEKNDILKQAMAKAARFYRNNLLKENEGRAAREYLLSRGITDEISQRYGLGLSLDYDGLQGYMRRSGFSIESLTECGLVNGERLTDAFANRIIVPIYSGMNEVIAFGGRIYNGEKDIAKYKNSTNTPLFDKSRTVYGINFVKKDKKEGASFKDLILVEGYMDVISLGASGIRNAVAGMGTALTEGQANEIKRLVPSIYVCYDGDGAGRKASVRNIEPLIKVGLDLKIVSLPDGTDPDDVVRREGYEGFMRYVAAALPLTDYKLKLCAEAYDLGSVNGRAKYVSAALVALKDIVSRAEREVYLQIVSKFSGVSVDTLAKEGFSVSIPTIKSESEIIDKESKNLRAARFVLNRMLDGAEYAKADGIKAEWFPTAMQREILEALLNGVTKVGDIFAELSSNEEIDRVLDVKLTFENVSKEAEYYFDCALAIANDYISGRLEFLRQSYSLASEADVKRAALVELSEYQRKLKSKNLQDKL